MDTRGIRSWLRLTALLPAVFLIIPLAASPPARSAGAPSFPIAWIPPAVELRIEPNGFRFVDVFFDYRGTSRQTATMQAVPSLQAFLRVSPTSGTLTPGGRTSVRLLVAVPETLSPGRTLGGTVHVRVGSQTLAQPLNVTLRIVPSTHEGTLRSVRAALEANDADQFTRQFVPFRQATYRIAFAEFTPEDRVAIAQALANPILLRMADNGRTAEYRVTLEDGGGPWVTTISLWRDVQGVWRVDTL